STWQWKRDFPANLTLLKAIDVALVLRQVRSVPVMSKSPSRIEMTYD
ncbi:bacterial regulatory helix-turn-helix s, AraC family protein, partial [Vibrio parahaemolyticus V-223/04]